MRLLYDAVEKTEPKVDAFVFSAANPGKWHGKRREGKRKAAPEGAVQRRARAAGKSEKSGASKTRAGAGADGRNAPQKRAPCKRDFGRGQAAGGKDCARKRRKRAEKKDMKAAGKKAEGRLMRNMEIAFRKEEESFKKGIASYIKQMDYAKEKILEEHLEELKDISLAVAEKIVRISLKNSSEIIKRMILEATDKLKRTGMGQDLCGQRGSGMRGCAETGSFWRSLPAIR